MSSFKSIAIAGGVKGVVGSLSAGLGYLVAKAILTESPGLEVKVLSRSVSASASDCARELEGLGAKLFTVNYTDEASLATVLDGCDVTLCFFGHDAVGEPQKALARAAKQSGCKLFVPSEYGNNPRVRSRLSPMWVKTQVVQYLEDSLQLPYTIFCTGSFAEMVKDWHFGVEGIKVLVIGTGDIPISFTATEDIARFVAFAITKLPLETLSNKTILIEGSRHTINDLIRIYNAKHSTTLEVTRESSISALFKYMVFGNQKRGLKYMGSVGNGDLTVKGDVLNNDLWKDWNPKDIEEFL